LVLSQTASSDRPRLRPGEGLRSKGNLTVSEDEARGRLLCDTSALRCFVSRGGNFLVLVCCGCGKCLVAGSCFVVTRTGRMVLRHRLGAAPCSVSSAVSKRAVNATRASSTEEVECWSTTCETRSARSACSQPSPCVCTVSKI
jgi:hypothetical protein